ncbi:aspartate dehydrogenase domain-containing protein [Burkholderia anthina]|uniref:aspartate dehydrogenase domain-containing protein n=1 Tax=Burkholderia anthina TaxID=179879 RepID=UPI001AA092F5|nr:DUF108 domain-containing protein [Burkholderia anthina]
MNAVDTRADDPRQREQCPSRETLSGCPQRSSPSIDRSFSSANVHAAIALAGLGSDRTYGGIVAVPNEPCAQHRIEVPGPELAWDVHVASRSFGGVTGVYMRRRRRWVQCGESSSAGMAW